MIKQLLIAGLLLILIMPCGSTVEYFIYSGSNVETFTWSGPTSGYASYDTVQDFTNVEKVKSTFNMWWIYIFIGIILFSIVVLGIKRVLRI